MENYKLSVIVLVTRNKENGYYSVKVYAPKELSNYLTRENRGKSPEYMWLMHTLTDEIMENVLSMGFSLVAHNGETFTFTKVYELKRT